MTFSFPGALWHQKQKIDVGARREHAAAITADGDNCRQRHSCVRASSARTFQSDTQQFVVSALSVAAQARPVPPASKLGARPPVRVERSPQNLDRRAAEGRTSPEWPAWSAASSGEACPFAPKRRRDAGAARPRDLGV